MNAMDYRAGDSLIFTPYTPPFRWGTLRARIAWCIRRRRLRAEPPKTYRVASVESTSITIKP